MCQVFNQGRVESTRDNRWRPTNRPSPQPTLFYVSLSLSLSLSLSFSLFLSCHRVLPPSSYPGLALPTLWLGVQLCRPHFRTASLLPLNCTVVSRSYLLLFSREIVLWVIPRFLLACCTSVSPVPFFFLLLKTLSVIEFVEFIRNFLFFLLIESRQLSTPFSVLSFSLALLEILNRTLLHSIN